MGHRQSLASPRVNCHIHQGSKTIWRSLFNFCGMCVVFLLLPSEGGEGGAGEVGAGTRKRGEGRAEGRREDLAILNTPPHLAIPVHYVSFWRFGSIIYLKQAPLMWRFRCITYLKHAPSCGDSGTSYILITPAHFAIPVHHIPSTFPFINLAILVHHIS